jgi:hypothetical protein
LTRIFSLFGNTFFEDSILKELWILLEVKGENPAAGFFGFSLAGEPLLRQLVQGPGNQLTLSPVCLPLGTVSHA